MLKEQAASEEASSSTSGPIQEEILNDQVNLEPQNQEAPNLPFRFDNELDLKFALHRLFTYPADFHFPNFKFSLANCGFYFTETRFVQCYHCKLDISNVLNIELNVEEQHRTLSPNCPLIIDVENCGDVLIPEQVTNYRYESHRLYSFMNTIWMGPVSQYDLAKNGFYWTGTEDNCRCYFCRLEVRNWEQGDTALGEHRRWNPNCIFLNNMLIGNVPIGHENVAAIIHVDAPINNQISSSSVCIAPQINYNDLIIYPAGIGSKLPVEVLGITHVNSARHPGYLTFTSRVESYKMWPKCLPQKPQDLAESGFFYTGCGDRVICFQCGGGLKDWSETDKPWAEHAKWFSKCPYLMFKREENFGDQNINFELNIQPNAITLGEEDTYTDFMPLTEEKNGDTSLVPTGSLLCVLCGVKNVEAVILPCGHVMTCMDCVEKSEKCPKCKKPRVAYVHAYL